MRTKVISRPLGNIEGEKSMEGIWKSEDRNYISKKPVSICLRMQTFKEEKKYVVQKPYDRREQDVEMWIER